MGTEDESALDAAVSSARAALHLAADVQAHACAVAPMAPRTRDFVLVVFGEAEAATAIATVDPTSGEVLESARLPGRESHALMPASEAIRRAGFGADTQARLVWGPSQASRSPFYPLWELRNGSDRAWVESVRGSVWRTLEASRGG